MTKTRYTEAECQDLVGDLLAVDRGLTDWEVGFAESVAEFYLQRGFLTPKQIAKAEAILKRLEDEV